MSPTPGLEIRTLFFWAPRFACGLWGNKQAPSLGWLEGLGVEERPMGNYVNYMYCGPFSSAVLSARPPGRTRLTEVSPWSSDSILLVCRGQSLPDQLMRLWEGRDETMGKELPPRNKWSQGLCRNHPRGLVAPQNGSEPVPT